jgi:hypothetical protein
VLATVLQRVVTLPWSVFIYRPGLLFVCGLLYTQNVIIKLCDEHGHLAKFLSIAHLRQLVPDFDYCECAVVLDDD